VLAVDGSFKAPSLRNVELTGPYMHNGGMLTLDQVVEFYTRGGDFHEANAANLDARIAGVGRLVGSPTNRANVVAFLKTLTDDRVRFESAPFDHPQLFIPNGHPGDAAHVTDDGTGKATDTLVELPASGAAGSCVELFVGAALSPGFAELSPDGPAFFGVVALVAPDPGAAGKSSFVTVRTGFAAVFFCSRARRAASATDGAESSWDCAQTGPDHAVKNSPAIARATNE